MSASERAGDGLPIANFQLPIDPCRERKRFSGTHSCLPFSCIGFKWLRFASTVFSRSVIVWHCTQAAKLGQGAAGIVDCRMLLVELRREVRGERALPVGVLGPVDCRAFWRLARRCSLETALGIAQFLRL